jgi:hypothetical protein
MREVMESPGDPTGWATARPLHHLGQPDNSEAGFMSADRHQLDRLEAESLALICAVIVVVFFALAVCALIVADLLP